MTHLWVRAEQRENEDRVGLTPDGARRLIEKVFKFRSKTANHASFQSRITQMLDVKSWGKTHGPMPQKTPLFSG